MESLTRSPCKPSPERSRQWRRWKQRQEARLPRKSLMKFLSVSKTWSSLIRSQRFVASYFAAKPSRFVAAFTNRSQASVRLFGRGGNFSSSSSSSLVANLDMTIPSVTLPGGSQYTSVHGFIAGCNEFQFIVCNP